MKVFADGDWVTLNDQEIEYGAYAKLTMMDDKIKRVHKILNEWCQDISNTTEQKYYDRIVQSLGGKDV